MSFVSSSTAPDHVYPCGVEEEGGGRGGEEGGRVRPMWWIVWILSTNLIGFGHLPHWGVSDLLVSSHQFFCSRYVCACAFSARSPCNLGCHADLAIFVLREASVNTVLARYHFCSRLWRWFTRRTRGCVPVSWNTFFYKILRKFFWPFWQITQRVSPYGLIVSIFMCFFFRFLLVHATGLPILCYSYSHFLLMRDVM